MTDRIVSFGAGENLVGLLSEGAASESARGRPAIIIFNAGLIHRVGPHRIFCKLARLLAETGFDILRFDFSGIGDSGYRQDNLPAVQSLPQEAAAAMDFLARTLGKTSFVLIGLCSGAAISFQMAARESRVVGAVLINPQAPGTPFGEELENSSVYFRKALFSVRSWVNFLFGKSNYRAAFNAFNSRIRNYVYRHKPTESEPEEIVTFIKLGLQEFIDRKKHLLIISSGIEVGADYLRQIAGNELKTLKAAGLLQFVNFPDADHTFTPLESQRQLFAAIQDWVQSAAPGRCARGL